MATVGQVKENRDLDSCWIMNATVYDSFIIERRGRCAVVRALYIENSPNYKVTTATLTEDCETHTH